MVELLEKNLVFDIVGCALRVINTVGHGFREKTYENGLCVELKHSNLEFSQQSSYPIYYRNELIAKFIPDIVVENRVIIELKTVETIIDEHFGQVLNYLKASEIKVGLILNFKHPKFEWERVVLDTAR